MPEVASGLPDATPETPLAQRPASASGSTTGFAGLGAAIAAIAGLHGTALSSPVKSLIVVCLAGLAMLMVEVLVHGTVLPRRPAAAVNWQRVWHKLLAFYTILASGALTYWLLPLYADPYYQPALVAASFALPVVVVVAIPYFTLVDQRLASPDDAYAELGRFLLGTRPAAWSPILNLLRGWLVKGYFLPLMFVFVTSDLDQIWALTAWPEFPSFQAIYAKAYDWLYLVDVLIATVGYLATLKLFGTEIRSAEPTVLGWVVCVLCYPPFWDALSPHYFSYDQDDVYWGALFWNMPALYIAWGSIILVLIAVYVWATLAFGLRFSNLTHRGIITSGPYRWVKHPAYLSKNITWWMISMPFIAGTGDWLLALKSCLLLGLVNAIYVLRAITEERHLAADPVYRQYQAFIARDGLAARLGRLFRAGRPDGSPGTA